MNYLAHLTLCRRDTHSVVGNLMGDFCKYRNGEPLPARVITGIEHHRRIDRFTDSHPVIAELKPLFSPGRRRFAGIILDMAFDHFLSCHWQRFCQEEIEPFIQHSYARLTEGMGYMPGQMQSAMQAMIREDWLGGYAQLSGIDEMLNRMSRRMRFENRLSGSVAEIENNYERFEAGFLQFYPALIELVQQDINLPLFGDD